jgi:epoxyqueuosine reductase
MKAAVAAEAARLGFDVCRFTRAGEPAHADAFRRWLAEGCAGEMDWMQRNADRRVDPQRVLPGARSIIVLGLNYFPEEPARSQPPAPRGRIARYAWGDDYHPVIERRLRELDGFLQRHGGTQKVYVDTGPVLERDVAAGAGAGWQGKSTMLIHRQFGTWLFLSEILTTLEFAPDEAERDHCGKCTRCIDACPTGAITEPHRVDARRCISYLTIEHKGSIPIALRSAMGDRIYGCDDCLVVCPWNRFAQVSRELAFAARPATTGMSLVDYLQLDEDQFRGLFRHSPIRRIKRSRFLRNVCVALGNVGTAAELPALEAAAGREDALIREHALWAIERIRGRIGRGNVTSLELAASAG